MSRTAVKMREGGHFSLARRELSRALAYMILCCKSLSRWGSGIVKGLTAQVPL